MKKISNVRNDLNGISDSDLFFYKFKSGGSESAKVDGSITPVEFKLEDLADGQKILISSISMTFDADENLDITKFGNRSALANGLLITFGNSTINIKDNADIFIASNSKETTTVTGLLGIGASTLLTASIEFGNTLSNNHSFISSKEGLKITVRDDLSGLHLFRISCYGVLLEDN